MTEQRSVVVTGGAVGLGAAIAAAQAATAHQVRPNDIAGPSAGTSVAGYRSLDTSSDIADMVMFLGSDRPAFAHDQNIAVDGDVTGSVISRLPRPAAADSVGHTL